MPKPLVALISWSKRAPLPMASFAHNVAAKMKGNASFPKPPVDADDTEAAAIRVEQAHSSRKNGAIAKTELINATNTLDELLHRLAGYVSDIAYGNAAVIESAGFTTTKITYTAAVEPGVPVPPKLSVNGGVMRVQTNKVQGAASYCWIVFAGEAAHVTVQQNYVDIPAGNAIKIIPDGNSREDIRGIETGTKVTVQVLAQNAAGKSNLSPAVSIIVGG